jgi:hypothetical protein
MGWTRDKVIKVDCYIDVEEVELEVKETAKVNALFIPLPIFHEFYLTSKHSV